MSVLEGVLLEEVQRLEKNIFEYQKRLSVLPRGTIYIKKIGESSFAYRKRKEKGKVISEYLGNINNADVKKEIELSKEYKRIKNNLRLTNQELCKLRKAVKAYNG